MNWFTQTDESLPEEMLQDIDELLAKRAMSAHQLIDALRLSHRACEIASSGRRWSIGGSVGVFELDLENAGYTIVREGRSWRVLPR